MKILGDRAIRLSGAKSPPPPERSAVEKAFDAAFAPLLEQGVTGPLRAAASAAASPPRARPSQVKIDCAERTLLKLIEQADSIIANPQELAARAWEIADAMQAEFEKRIK